MWALCLCALAPAVPCPLIRPSRYGSLHYLLQKVLWAGSHSLFWAGTALVLPSYNTDHSLHVSSYPQQAGNSSRTKTASDLSVSPYCWPRAWHRYHLFSRYSCRQHIALSSPPSWSPGCGAEMVGVGGEGKTVTGTSLGSRTSWSSLGTFEFQGPAWQGSWASPCPGTASLVILLTLHPGWSPQDCVSVLYFYLAWGRTLNDPCSLAI